MNLPIIICFIFTVAVIAWASRAKPYVEVDIEPVKKEVKKVKVEKFIRVTRNERFRFRSRGFRFPNERLK